MADTQAAEGTPRAKEIESNSARLQRLEVEAKELEVQFKKLQFQDLQEQIDERVMRRSNKSERARINGNTITALTRNKVSVQLRCNHRKGGQGADGVVAGQGDDNQYAVMKHFMANRDLWVSCLRCHKTWSPPIREDFETEAGYLGALAEYQTAKDFPTRNQTSGSVPFQWGDGGLFYRKQMRNTTIG